MSVNKNIHPKAYQSEKVTLRDGVTGDPLTTEFYRNDDLTGLVFTWYQTWVGGKQDTRRVIQA